FSLNSHILNTIEVAMSMDSKRLETRTAIVIAMAATAIVLFGRFCYTISLRWATQFNVDFESSGTPGCTTEEVAFSGTQHFVFQDVNGRQTVHVNYQNVKGVGVQQEHNTLFTRMIIIRQFSIKMAIQH
ncbi:MAG: hypothetical protein WBQ16_02240, partial [Nitrososphaeraceae archaeon]